ncbi:MAG TPA: NlpC/P60 family protein, partial [Patescibacteria group bacterium]|nr:NlpC/P60 family protein [Patescibacteria group bacterium]
YAGTWYSWGGDNPSGFDCSGMSVEYCKAGCLLPRNCDYSAEGLLTMYSDCVVSIPFRGCLAFRVNQEGVAKHVAICLNRYQVLDASGGGPNTKTRDDAIRDNAFIKVRSVNKVFDIFVDPFKRLSAECYGSG